VRDEVGDEDVGVGVGDVGDEASVGVDDVASSGWRAKGFGAIDIWQHFTFHTFDLRHEHTIAV
jgi:hypothetical protein